MDVIMDKRLCSMRSKNNAATFPYKGNCNFSSRVANGIDGLQLLECELVLH